MRQNPIYVALVCGVALLGGVSAASAGCGCGMRAAYPVVAVAPITEPVLIGAPPPVPVAWRFPYLHGYDFYNHTYYSVGPYGNPVGYRGYYHPYAEVGSSGLLGVGPRVTPVGPDYVRARHQPVWRLARRAPAYRRYYGPWHGPYPHPLRPEDK